MTPYNYEEKKQVKCEKEFEFLGLKTFSFLRACEFMMMSVVFWFILVKPEVTSQSSPDATYSFCPAKQTMDLLPSLFLATVYTPTPFACM